MQEEEEKLDVDAEVDTGDEAIPAETTLENSEETGDAKDRGIFFPSKQFKEQSELAIPATVFMLAGCKDSQVSADVVDVALLRPEGAGLSGGACTNAYLGMLNEEDRAAAGVTWMQILDELRDRLKHYSQVPQLSCSKMVDIKKETFRVINPLNEEGVSVKRALLVGINYYGQEYELSGCINDVKAAKKFLKKHGYKDENILCVIDDGHHKAPTFLNLIQAFRWFVRDTKSGDSLYFHFSGHGSYVPDENGDEVDGQDETLLPLDYETKGAITDDVLLKELVLPLPEGVQLTCFVDACHSESVLDIPYTVKATGDYSRGLFVNPSYEFSKLVQIGKDVVGDVEETLSGGLHNLAKFAKDFGSVFPL